jgi:hypothetical protein
MNLIPLRNAAIAGTCAVALSFVALPAYASVSTDAGSSSCTTSDTSGDSTTGDDDSTDTSQVGTDDSSSTDVTTPDDTMMTGIPVTDTTSTDSSMTPALRAYDDTAATDDTCDSDDDSDATATAPLPAEKGTAKQHFAQTVFTPKEIAKKGIKVEYTGLTAGKTYQPFESTGQSGGPIGDVRTASKKGTITFTYKFAKAEKSFTTLGAVYTVGLLGQDTDLRLTQEIAVKYDSDLTWNTAERHGKKVTLSVSVDKDDKAGKSSDWKKVSVEFQKKVGTKWVTVKTVKTNSKGAAKATIKAGVTTWRAVLAGSHTVIGATSGGHRK